MEDDEKSDGTEVVQCECQDPNEDGGMFQCDGKRLQVVRNIVVSLLTILFLTVR